MPVVAILTVRLSHCVRLLIQLVSDVRRFKWACLEEEGACDNVVIATKLANIGYTVSCCLWSCRPPMLV